MFELLFCGVAIFLAGLAQGCTGFGLGMIAAPSLMTLLPPAAVVPVVVSLSIINSGVVTWHGRKSLAPSLVGPLILFGLVGLPIGIHALHVADARYIRLLAGCVVSGFVTAQALGWRRPIRNQMLGLPPVALLGGFLGGSTAMAGPPIILFLSNQSVPKDAFRANIICFFWVNSIMAAAIFAWRGMYTMQVLRYAMLLLPALLAGTYAGVRLSKHVTETQFRLVVLLGAGTMGAVLIVTSVRSILF